MNYNDRLTTQEKNAFVARNLNIGAIFTEYEFSMKNYYIITKTTPKCVYYKPVNFITIRETLNDRSSINKIDTIDTIEQIDPEQNYAYVKGQDRKMKSKIDYSGMFHNTIEDNNQFIQLGDTINTYRYLN